MSARRAWAPARRCPRAPLLARRALVVGIALLLGPLAAPSAHAGRRSPARVLKEVVMTLDASAAHPPPRDELARAGLRALASKASCLRHTEQGATLTLSCQEAVSTHAWPPKSGLDVVEILTAALALASNDGNPKALVEFTARALARSLGDPYTAYLSPAEVRELSGTDPGQVASPGIELSPLEPNRIREVRPGSDAARKGLRAGERIVKIDGEDASTLTLAQMGARILGPNGTLLQVVVEGTDGALRTHRVERSLLPEPLVFVDELPGAFLYVRISSFGPGIARTVKEEVWDRQSRGLVLDLRHNHGGLITEGAALLDLFFVEGPIGGVRPRPGRPATDFSAKREPTDLSLPLVVLVDGASASAAELVTLVLKERDRATVLGARSLGKGSVQHLIHLPDGGLLRVTNAHYVGFLGRRLAKGGITPDTFLAPPSGRTVLEGGLPARDVWVLAARDLLEVQSARTALDPSLYGPLP